MAPDLNCVAPVWISEAPVWVFEAPVLGTPFLKGACLLAAVSVLDDEIIFRR